VPVVLPVLVPPVLVPVVAPPLPAVPPECVVVGSFTTALPLQLPTAMTVASKPQK
jgi:hypothetical protein